MKYLKKLFGGIELTWKKLIIFAVISGIYAGTVLIIPPLEDTSFTDIGAKFEWWVFFAMIIITNCKKPTEASLKTFVFFLISQPIIYIVQIPFSEMGIKLLEYYPPWFLYTLCTIPMAFIGFYTTKEKWYSPLILTSMTLLLAEHWASFTHIALYKFPHHLLSAVFCIVQIFVLIFLIIKNIKLRIVGTSLAVIAIIFCFFTEIYHQPYMGINSILKEADANVSYEITVADEDILTVKAIENNDTDYKVYIEFLKTGNTEMTLTDPNTGNQLVYLVEFGKNYYCKIELK